MTNQTDQKTHWLPETLKDKQVKFLFKVILTALTLLILFLVIKSLCGYNVNWFGLETNPKTIIKTDTVPIIKHDTVCPDISLQSPNKGKFVPKSTHAETTVTSHDQKGGQTGGTIINNTHPQ